MAVIATVTAAGPLAGGGEQAPPAVPWPVPAVADADDNSSATPQARRDRADAAAVAGTTPTGQPVEVLAVTLGQGAGGRWTTDTGEECAQWPVGPGRGIGGSVALQESWCTGCEPGDSLLNKVLDPKAR